MTGSGESAPGELVYRRSLYHCLSLPSSALRAAALVPDLPSGVQLARIEKTRMTSAFSLFRIQGGFRKIDTSIYTAASTLIILRAFPATIRIALVLGHKVEIRRRLAQEHFRNLDPIARIRRGELRKRVSKGDSTRSASWPTRVSVSQDSWSARFSVTESGDLPSSFRPLYSGGRSFICGGIRSSKPIGMYRCWNDNASHKNLLAVLTPRVSAP